MQKIGDRGVYLLRYHSPAWSLLIAASGTLMTLCFYVMTAVALWQLLRPARN